MPGTLVVCATPIGNLDDVSPRLAAALREADVVFAEDTRRTAKLLSHVGATTPMRSFFTGNERARLDELESLLVDDDVVALVSDAGTPGVSDPGAAAVRRAAEAGARITVVPGPSAVTTAISVSGFDGDRFVFEGFLPRKGEPRREAIHRIAEEQRTTVLFAAPSRVDRDLTDLAEACEADRDVVVMRELSKLHEELWRGSLAEAAETFTGDRARGEFVVAISGAEPPVPDLGAALETVERLTAAGMSTSDAVREASSTHGVSRRELYDLAIRSRN
jgi:16S rRNA (cytidine1402-2'-O)-methyltransferase